MRGTRRSGACALLAVFGLGPAWAQAESAGSVDDDAQTAVGTASAEETVAQNAGDSLRLEPIAVAGPAAGADRFYGAEVVDSLGYGLPRRELPVTVNVISRDFLQDTQADSVADVLTYIPGVNTTGADGSAGSRFTIRGFSTEARYFNGLRQFRVSAYLQQ